jgi:hypothetical protein
MEELKSLLIEKWPDIISFLSVIVSYFLIYIYKNRMTIAKNTMTMIFKENTNNVEKEMKETSRKVERELVAAKKSYEDAVSQIKELKAQLERTQRAVLILLETEEENDGAEIFDDGRNTEEIG